MQSSNGVGNTAMNIINSLSHDDSPDDKPSPRSNNEYRDNMLLQSRKRMFSELCPPNYASTDPSRLNKGKLDQVMAWLPGPQGLFLVGQSGTGKTRSMWLLLESLVLKGMSLKWFDGFGWQVAVSNAFGNPDSTERWMDSLVKHDLIFLDDIFKGKLTEAQELAIYGLLERRQAYRKPVFITTNTNSESLFGRMTEAGQSDRIKPIMRRITETCDVVQF